MKRREFKFAGVRTDELVISSILPEPLLFMTRLPNPPLVEAIVELHWELNGAKDPLEAVDPGYPFVVGSLREEFRSKYPHVQRLQAADIPDRLTPHIVKFQFRAEPNGWPLIQIGPGVMTLNYTQTYTWSVFQRAAGTLHRDLLKAYESLSVPPPRFKLAVLRYINAVGIGDVAESPVPFMDRKLHVGVTLPGAIGGSHGAKVDSLDLRAGVPISEPAGTGSVRLATGKRGNVPALIVELQLRSASPDSAVPQRSSEFDSWLESAHEVLGRWFVALTEGELDASFRELRTSAVSE